MFKSNCLIPRVILKLQKINYGKNLRLVGWPFIFRFSGANIAIGDNVKINSNFWSNFLGLYQRTIIIARHGGCIEIADNVGMSGCTIYAWDTIKIGKNTIIGANVKIVDNDFHPIDAEDRLRGNNQSVKRKPVIIGSNVFVGMNSIILKGTTIGDNCVIGAGSVVSGQFPNNSIIAGNPAKVINR